ncbi:protein CDC73 homolog [Cornus florida]|uniref:protein CDC73 homolog n=1 Tax=Cornus florida TaxID=4283 RepID=UPI00289A8BB6|nr:protein CDC73 homolog [Cornus florida]
MDPLSALRDFTIAGELDKIVRVGDDFRFGTDYTFPCSMATAYKAKQGQLYTLETLIHFIKNHHLKHSDYIRIAGAHKITAVTLPDRKSLLDYLLGKVSSTDAIQLLPQNPPFTATTATRTLFNDDDEYRPDDPGLIAPPTTTATADNRMDIDNEDRQFQDNDVLNHQHSSDGRVIRVSEDTHYMSMLRAVEKPLKDRESMLESRHRDFYSVLVAATKRDEERRRIESQQRKDGLVAKNRLLMRTDERGYGDELGYDMTPKSKMHLKGGKMGEGLGVPIILVPSAFQTLITIYNVKDFLENGVFIPTDVKVKEMKGLKPDCVTVQKKFSRDRVVTAYEVRDKPSALKPEDWDRVVAVFVLGKEWQFKDWPYKDHVEIFNKILGFYMRFEDDSVESAKNVKQWNVKIISISKNKRHQDRAAALDVWDRLEEFMRSRSHG